MKETDRLLCIFHIHLSHVKQTDDEGEPSAVDLHFQFVYVLREWGESQPEFRKVHIYRKAALRVNWRRQDNAVFQSLHSGKLVADLALWGPLTYMQGIPKMAGLLEAAGCFLLKDHDAHINSGTLFKVR